MTHHTIASDGKQFFDQINSYLSVEDRLRVQDAFSLARREHGNQRRKSGELFFTHPLTVAFYISQYLLDAPAIIAALLHDVAEDTRISIEDIENEFGPEVGRLVDGVTKLKDVTKRIGDHRELTKKEVEEATLHKLLGVMTTDVRAVLIKLFDRLHNMRTIESVPFHRQVYKAQETLDVYAPLANRLGIWKVKNELECRSLKILYPSQFAHITRQRELLVDRQEKLFPAIKSQILSHLGNADIDVRDVILAPENISTLFNDVAAAKGKLREIDQTMRIVVHLGSWTECYGALGHLHNLWKPVPLRFDDYIAYPRNNLYRSLHTTVMHTNGRHLKLRLRTIPMDKVSEVGVLARWLYKGTSWHQAVEERIATFFENIEENINLDPHDPITGVRTIVEDVFGKQQIQVYTPNGDLKELAKGATAIDFAYSIHTGLGDQCHGAYVNDTPFPLNKPLSMGDQVRIIKRIKAQPQRAWLEEDLGYIATTYARVKARRWFRRLSDKEAISQGKQLLQSELQMLGFPNTSHQYVASLFDFSQIQLLYLAIGKAELLPSVLATRLLEEKWGQVPKRDLDNVALSAGGEQFIITNADHRKLRLCGTCEPRPPDEILGYIRQDEGVTVHNIGCQTLQPTLSNGRIIKLGWGNSTQRQARPMTIHVSVYDRPGLLFEITELMQEQEVNISFINTPPAHPGYVDLIITLEIHTPDQFVSILHQIKALLNVSKVVTVNEHFSSGEQLPANSLYRPE